MTMADQQRDGDDMQFLKTLFWVALAVVLVVFAANNWEPVSVGLWGGLRMDTKLPVLVISAFLIGFLPLYLVYRTMLWRLRRRVASLESSQRAATASATAPNAADASAMGGGARDRADQRAHDARAYEDRAPADPVTGTRPSDGLSSSNTGGSSL
jgi:putative membrane protein